MNRFYRAVFLLATISIAAAASAAPQQSGAERAYFRAVARYFQMPEGEVAILGNWDLPADEVPVLLFVARRAGVSAEALVALREAGYTWPELSRRYQIGAHALHVPVHDAAAVGRLSPLYATFRDTPVTRWDEIALSSEDIIALVNVRVLAQTLGLVPDEIMRRTTDSTSFVELYALLIG